MGRKAIVGWLAVAAIAGGLVVGWRVWRTPAGPKYVTAPVRVGTVVEIVTETGTVTADDRRLFFELSGVVEAVPVSVGEHVEAGAELIRLNGDTLRASLRAAEASQAAAAGTLRQLYAGSTAEERALAETEVKNAETALVKAKQDLADTRQTSVEQVRTKEVALEAAQTRLRNAEEEALTKLAAAEQTALNVSQSALVDVSAAISDSDLVLGIDNESANDEFEENLARTDEQALVNAERSYQVAKNAAAAAASVVAQGQAADSSAREALSSAAVALDAALALLDDVKTVLEATVSDADFTQTELNAKLSGINADRTAIAGHIVTVGDAGEDLKTVEAGNRTAIDAAEDAVSAALQDLATTQAKADADVRAAEGAVSVAEGALRAARDEQARVVAPPRPVDAEALAAEQRRAEAEVARLKKELEKTVLRAPAAGTVAELPFAAGEIATTATLAALLITDNAYDVEMNVSELDIARINAGDPAGLSVEALGLSSYSGVVDRVDPTEILVDEDVFYNVTIRFVDSPPPVRSGMSVDVAITTDTRQGVLTVPERAVFRKAGRDTVRLLRDGVVEERVVDVGLRSLDTVEIRGGLSEGETIIVEERR